MTLAAAELFDLADRALDGLPPGWAADVRVGSQRWGTMRFADSRLHQPALEEGLRLSLRVVHDQRVGIATTTDPSPEGLRRLVRRARAISVVSPRDPQFPTFPSDGVRPREVARSLATARLTPEGQVRLARTAIDSALGLVPDGRVAGALHVGHDRFVVVNTAGRRAASDRTATQVSVRVERPRAEPPTSGWDEAAHWDVEHLDVDRVGRRAAEAVPRTRPTTVRPGTYRVVLAGPAMAELLGFRGYLGFDVRGEEQGWSCLARRRGRRIAPSSVHLVDDGASERTLPQAIDFEGTPKSRRVLVDHGVAAGPVNDLRSAARRGERPTGHAPPPESPYGDWGPLPTQMILAPGDARDAELLGDVKDGLWITRFHYVRVVHPAEGILTGMTRDGTYRIRGGEVAEPVRNLRFTQSLLEALRSVRLVGREARRYGDERGSSAVSTPSASLGTFRFTSATIF